MITVTTYPAPVSPARNQMVVGLQSDNYLTASSAIAELRFGFLYAAFIGDTLELSWGGGSANFTFVGSPDPQSGEELSAYPGAGTLIAWAQQVVLDLRRNWLLSRDFDITYSGNYGISPTISIRAKAPGASYTITVGTTPASYVLRQLDAGADEVLREYFRLQVEVEEETSWLSGQFQRLVSLEFVPVAGLSSFDLSEIVRATLSAELPDFHAYLPILAYRMTARFRLHAVESWGSPRQYGPAITTDAIQAVLAGIDPTLWPGYDFPAKERFLSWWPDDVHKPVTLNQHEWLYFLLDATGVTQLQLEATATWEDGSTTTAVIMATPPLQLGEIYVFPAGPTQLGLPALSSLALSSYSLQLLDQNGDPCSKVRNYEVLSHPWPHARHLLFRNSLGGIDTILLTGSHDTERLVDRREVERALETGYSTVQPQFSSTLEKSTLNVTARSGWMHRQMAEWWQDLILKAEAWEQRSDRYVSVTISTAKLRVSDDQTDLWALEVQYAPAFNLHSYTPIPT